MSLVVDTSVALKWILPEEHGTAAEALLLNGTAWIVPEFLLVEVGNVLRTKIMRRELALPQARAGMKFIASTMTRLVPDRDLVDEAFELASELDHSIYDCLYLACANRENAQLVTADLRFFRKAASSPYRNRVRMLAS